MSVWHPSGVQSTLREALIRLGFDQSPSWWAASESGSSPTIRRFEVEPHEYLGWAEAALEQQTTAGDVHAILDAKRAIDAVTDRLLDIAGIDRGSLSRARRMDAIVQMNVAAPRIIRRMTDTRNRLEHEYERPSHADAETAVDVATLFFAASRHLEIVFPDEFTLTNQADGTSLGFSRWLTAPTIAFSSSDVGPERLEGEVRPDASEFPLLIGLAVAGHLEYREDEAIAAFRRHLRV